MRRLAPAGDQTQKIRRRLAHGVLAEIKLDLRRGRRDGPPGDSGDDNGTDAM
jgi:hypothetical protein